MLSVHFYLTWRPTSSLANLTNSANRFFFSCSQPVYKFWFFFQELLAVWDWPLCVFIYPSIQIPIFFSRLFGLWPSITACEPKPSKMCCCVSFTPLLCFYFFLTTSLIILEKNWIWFCFVSFFFSCLHVIWFVNALRFCTHIIRYRSIF